MAPATRSSRVPPDASTSLLQPCGGRDVRRQARLLALGAGRALLPFELGRVCNLIAHTRIIRKGPLPTAAPSTCDNSHPDRGLFGDRERSLRKSRREPLPRREP